MSWELVAGTDTSSQTQTASPRQTGRNWELVAGKDVNGRTPESWLSSAPARIGAGILGATAAIPFLPEEAGLMLGAGAMTAGSQLAGRAREYMASRAENRPAQYPGAGDVAREYGTNLAGYGVAKQFVAPFLSEAAPAMSNVPRAGLIGASAGVTGGGFGGAMQNPKHPFIGAGKGMVEGAGIGMATGAGGQRLINAFTPRPPVTTTPGHVPFPSAEELAAATPEVQMKMNPEERSQSFKAQQQATQAPFIRKQAEVEQRGRDIIGIQKSDVQRLQESIETYKTRVSADLVRQQEQSKNLFENKKFEIAQKVQADLPTAMKANSDIYRGLVDEGMQTAGNQKLSKDEVFQALNDHVEANPDLEKYHPGFVKGVMNLLGFKEPEPFEISTGFRNPDGSELKLMSNDPRIQSIASKQNPMIQEALKGAEKPKTEISVKELYGKIRSQRSEIPTAARAGTKLYTASDSFSDNTSKALSDVIASKSPEAMDKFSEASEHWAKYAPIRNQAFSQFDPFVKQPIGLKPGMSTLEDVSKTPFNVKTPNTVFVGELEKYMSMEPGSLSKELKQILGNMTSEQQRVVAANISRDQLVQDLRKSLGTGIKATRAGAKEDVGNVLAARTVATGKLQRQQSEVKSAKYDERKYGQKNNALARVVKRVAWFLGLRVGYKILRGMH